MTLVLCPECHSQVSTRAGACPQCGYPLTGDARVPARATEPRPPQPHTFVSTRFALAASVFLLVTGGFAMGGAEDEGFAIFAGLMAWASIIPIWWKNRRAAREAALPTAAIERQMDVRLKEMEDRFRGPLAQLEDGSRQLMEIEERMEFLERLLTKQRDEQLGAGS